MLSGHGAGQYQDKCLPGREQATRVAATHYVNGNNVYPPFPDHLETALFAMGCFWGAERRFWETAGVYSTSVGYTAGTTPNPTYQEVCTGRTGHTEAVRVIFNPAQVTFRALLKIFWESHDPSQGMRQGNDIGTQYRSGIYVFNDEQHQAARRTLQEYQAALGKAGHPAITTEIKAAEEFYFAEDYHQQYLAKNPQGYCGMGGTGIALIGERFE